MTTPNDLPSVGTEDIVQRVADLVQKHATAYAHDRFQQASNFEEKIDEKVRSLAAERDELASRVRELEGENDRLIKALGECRDIFPAPPRGGAAEHEWMQAMGCPESVPNFIRAALAAQPGSVGEPERMQDRLLNALERAARAETALRALVDECGNDVTPGWEERMTQCINSASELLAAAPTEAKPAQPCGHPESLLLKSAETGEPLYCEACDDKSGRRDAEQRETELLAANQALREKIAALSKPAQDAVDATIPLDKEELAQLIASMLYGTYHCTRVWEAWNVGTMSRDDFEPVDESETPTEIADAIIDAIRAAISAKKGQK